MAAAGLSDAQLSLAAKLVRIGERRGATRKEEKSAIETGLVESNLSNPSGGDADSAGWRQERASLYKDPTNVRDAARRYYAEARQRRGQYATAGALAAAVQRPAAQYAGRYQEVAGKAEQVLQAVRGGAGGGAAVSGGVKSQAAVPVAQAATGDASGIQAALASILQRPEMQRSVSAPPVPTLLQGGAQLLGGAGIQTAGAGAAPAAMQTQGSSAVSDLLAAANAQGQATTSAVAPVVSSGSAGAAPAAAGKVAKGRVVIAKGADRSGVNVQKPVLRFLARVAGVAGEPITITTGTNHNQYVAGEPGVQSDHWTGNASDLGMGGDARQSAAVSKKGDHVAASAIVAASGMSYAKALKLARAGGVHNFETKQGRVQVIWKTNIGGNHYNHVHVGVEPGR